MKDSLNFQCLFLLLFCGRMTIIDNSQWILPAHPKLPKGKTLAVVVLDGWGEQVGDEYNAIHVAHTPTMDSLKDVRINSFSLHPLHFTCQNSMQMLKQG